MADEFIQISDNSELIVTLDSDSFLTTVAAGTTEYIPVAGLTLRGAYSVFETYYLRDLVTYMGSAYVNTSTTIIAPGNSPPNNGWTLLVQKGTDGAEGQQGPPGVGAVTFVYGQNNPTTMWTINHNLNKFPSVQIVDSTMREIWGEVRFINSNTVEVYFNFPQSGQAYLN